MKNHQLLIVLVFIAFIAMALYVGDYEGFDPKNFSDSSESNSGQKLTQTRLETDADNTRVKRNRPTASGSHTREDEVENLKRELKTARTELEILSSPLTEDILSSAVNAEIAPGDTLVTGGYKTADGNYEMTFITPRTVTRSDGSEGIEIQSRVLSVGPEFVDKSGMGTLATNAGNTLQHGESWKADDVKTTFTSASQNSGVNVMTAPKFTTSSSASSPFDIVIGGEGEPQFSIRGTVEKNANGNFSIKSRVERRPGVEPDAGLNP
jgi:hypothetical protein